MVLYFSGTGNSKYAAYRIANLTESGILPINDRIKSGSSGTLYSGSDIVVVAPTYAWRLPGIVTEWLENTTLLGAKRVWFVMTCGSETGNAAKYNRELCDKKQLEYMGTASIIMPENYIAMFNAPASEEAEKIVSEADPAIIRAAAAIKSGVKLPDDEVSLIDRIKSSAVNPLFYAFCVKGKGFHATDKCRGCGACAKLCPLNNIKLANGKPKWGRDCTHCMACICLCPEEAVEYKDKTRGKPRYHL